MHKSDINEMKKGIKNIILLLGAIYGALFFAVTLYEIYLIKTGTESFIHLFSLSPHGLHWQFLSVRNLIIWDAVTALCYGFYALINVFCYLKNSKYLFILVVLMDLLIVGMIIRYYILLEQSGFDHYPGFDPYLF